MQLSSESSEYVIDANENNQNYYYYEAVNDINENCCTLRPSEWRDLVKIHEKYIIAVDKLSQYIYRDDETALKMFKESCADYVDYY